jgi:2-haloacid dehalogenase
MVRAILFDVFGTVVDWRGGIIAELAAWGRDRGIERDWAAFADAWRAKYKPSMDRVRRGERGWATIDRLHRQSLDELLVVYGLDDVDAADRQRLTMAWHRLAPWPDAVGGLTRLKSQYVIGTLSNGNVALLVDLSKQGRLPWDVIISAEMFRHYKPDPQLYLGACALLGCAPGDVMLVAAHTDDLQAARSLGMLTAYIPRPTESPDQVWDVIVGDIAALADRLGV